MIGRRPYRPPLAPSVALERLVEGRGEQFDPDIVDAMIDVVTLRA
jgi:HD-GYP domain-containing protein (c-di-GMP phosphodiesterase class II)